MTSLLTRFFATGPLGACAAAAILASSSPAFAGPIGSRFDPDDYSDNGALNLTTGSLTFDTDALTFSGAASGSGTAVTSQGGGVELALFNFTDLDLTSGVTITVTGSRGIVLGSKSNIDFGATMSVNGGNAATAGSFIDAGGSGGPGAEGGSPGSTFNSAPPPGNAGDGGADFEDGVGYGAGRITGTFTPGSGGGYGGAGGGPDGGISYGDDQLTELYGGSGGSGSNKQNADHESVGGGGGGGAISLTASGTINLSGILEARGGNGADESQNGFGGGGGSGGGILLNADILTITGSIDVSGGDGGDQPTQSGRVGSGGGGGRIALYYQSGFTDNGTYNVSGGNLRNPEDGTLFIIPEPASLALMGLGGVILLGRRRRA